MKKKYKCNLCGYEWNPKSKFSTKPPIACPNCKRYDYAKAKKLTEEKL